MQLYVKKKTVTDSIDNDWLAHSRANGRKCNAMAESFILLYKDEFLRNNGIPGSLRLYIYIIFCRSGIEAKVEGYGMC